MDVLTDFLNMAGAHIGVDPVIHRDGKWGNVSPRTSEMAFYAMAVGSCRLAAPEHETELLEGDVAILTHDGPHWLQSTNSAEVAVVSGHVRLSVGLRWQADLELPPRLLLRAAEGFGSAEIVGRLAAEVTAARPGWEALTAGLAMSLFVDALRSHGGTCAGVKGWLRGLADPEIGQALQLMHEHPAHRWTVAELAEALSVSRSSFAARFKQVTGRPPLDYLTWWRLHRAAVQLRRGDGASIKHIAGEAGYESDVSFGKAFRRMFGKTPGEVRREFAAGGVSPLQYELRKRDAIAAEHEPVVDALAAGDGVTAGRLLRQHAESFIPTKTNPLN